MNQNYFEYQNYFDNDRQVNMSSYNNMNYNNPNFTPKQNPTDLYDAYDGFIRGNMFKNLYNQYKISKPYEIKPMNDQAQLLTYVYALGFASTDLNLYLDNFPNDKEMIELYNQYIVELKRVKEEYESHFGPLCVENININKNKWLWNNAPWPWEQ